MFLLVLFLRTFCKFHKYFSKHFSSILTPQPCWINTQRQIIPTHTISTNQIPLSLTHIHAFTVETLSRNFLTFEYNFPFVQTVSSVAIRAGCPPRNRSGNDAFIASQISVSSIPIYSLVFMRGEVFTGVSPSVACIIFNVHSLALVWKCVCVCNEDEKDVIAIVSLDCKKKKKKRMLHYWIYVV